MDKKMGSRTKKALCLVIVGIVANLALALTKYFIGLRTNSLCILLDSTNGFLDMFTGIVTAIAFGLTAVAPTEKYPYGFGRCEYLAGFIVAVVAGIMGITFFMESLNRMAMPEPVWFGYKSCILIGVTVLVKLALAVTFALCNRKIRSKALSAVTIDAFLDVGITSATILSFTLTQTVGYAIDAIFGIAISVVVVGVAVKMIVDAVRVLVGNNECAEEKEALVIFCREENAIDQVNGMRFHDYGYHAKYGNVFVTYRPDATEDERIEAAARVAGRLKERTGATVEILLYMKTTEQ